MLKPMSGRFGAYATNWKCVQKIKHWMIKQATELLINIRTVFNNKIREGRITWQDWMVEGMNTVNKTIQNLKAGFSWGLTVQHPISLSLEQTPSTIIQSSYVADPTQALITVGFPSCAKGDWKLPITQMRHFTLQTSPHNSPLTSAYT